MLFLIVISILINIPLFSLALLVAVSTPTLSPIATEQLPSAPAPDGGGGTAIAYAPLIASKHRTGVVCIASCTVSCLRFFCGSVSHHWHSVVLLTQEKYHYQRQQYQTRCVHGW